MRLLHWMLAALVVFDLVHDDGGYAHRLVGYAAAAVVLLRLAGPPSQAAQPASPA